MRNSKEFERNNTVLSCEPFVLALFNPYKRGIMAPFDLPPLAACSISTLHLLMKPISNSLCSEFILLDY